MPALFALGGNERKRQQNCNSQERHDEKKRRLHRRWQVRQNGVDPQKKEIRLRNCLDDRGIRPSAGAEGAEDKGADRNRSQNRARKNEVLPEGAGDERKLFPALCLFGRPA